MPAGRARGSGSTFSATPGTSPRPERVLLQVGQFELPEEDDLVLEVDAVLLPGAAARLGHEGECVRRARAVGVLDEVRMPRRDLRAADAVALEPARLEHPAGAQLVLRVFEDAAVCPLVRGLRCLALRLEVRDECLDLRGWTGRQPKLDLGDHLPGPQAGPTVLEAELVSDAPARAAGVDDECALEDAGPVAAVGARVHAHAAAGGAWNRARELEPAQPGCAGAVQCDRVRRAAARYEQVVADLCPRELPRELQHKPVEAGVRDQEVRAETDHRDPQLVLAGIRERRLKLAQRFRPRERRRGPAGAESREAREHDVPIDVHASNSSSSGAARSTSPAPIVSARSPLRACVARKRTPSTGAGVHASGIPGRRSASASTTSLPLTPASGSSRAAYTSVTATTSAPASAAANSEARWRVRE